MVFSTLHNLADPGSPEYVGLVLSRADSSLLLVKLPPEADSEYFQEPFTCR